MLVSTTNMTHGKYYQYEFLCQLPFDLSDNLLHLISGTQTDVDERDAKSTVESEAQCNLLNPPEDDDQRHPVGDNNNDRESPPVPENTDDEDYKPPSDESPSSDSEMYR